MFAILGSLFKYSFICAAFVAVVALLPGIVFSWWMVLILSGLCAVGENTTPEENTNV